MSASSDAFDRTLANLLRARVPLLLVRTWEEARAVACIARVARDADLVKKRREVHTWSIVRGMRRLDEAGRESAPTPLKALDWIEACDEDAVFILKDFGAWLSDSRGRQPDTAVVRQLLDLSVTLKRGKPARTVVLVSAIAALPLELQRAVTVIDFELPGEEEVATLLREMVEMNDSRKLEPEVEQRLVQSALGLTLDEAENAFAIALVGDGTLDAQDVAIVLEEKRQALRRSEVLEYVVPNVSFADVGGLQNLKHWLAKRDGSWNATARDWGLPAPRGILITGVPGCGKSLSAKCTGSLWGLPLLRLDVGRVFEGLVGSSEENMRAALATAEALAPSILWIDEVEKGFSNSTGTSDAGTSMRVFGTFLTWMQEKKRPVFVIATANRIEALPPEFLRKGRFDEIFFVDIPTRSERVAVFDVHLRRRLEGTGAGTGLEVSDSDLEQLAEVTEGFTGAEIEQAVVSGMYDAYAEGRGLTITDVEKAIANTVPLSVTQAETIRHIREWAGSRAVSATSAEDRAEYQLAGVGASESGGGLEPPPDDVRTARGGRALDL